jgi:uncharacterized protein (DUF302 family)
MKVFLDLDQQAEALGVGLEIPKAHLLLFGRPASGTQILLECPEAGIDLPLKVFVWESEHGGTHVSYDSPYYIAERYPLSGAVRSLFGVVTLVAEVVVRSRPSPVTSSRAELPSAPT